jgi:hypothetical protein
MNAAEAKRETDSLAKRHPKKGIDGTIPPEIRDQLMERRREKMSPMAHGGMAKGYAKGGSVKGSGCEQRGLRKCKVV